MLKITAACLCLSLAALSGCANTAYGLKRDGQATSAAMDDASHRVLKAGAAK